METRFLQDRLLISSCKTASDMVDVPARTNRVWSEKKDILLKRGSSNHDDDDDDDDDVDDHTMKIP